MSSEVRVRGSATGQFKNTQDKFWTLVEKSDQGCWTWKAGTNNLGYGRWWFKGRRRYAHVLSFFFIHGRWPAKFICHSCDNPICVNPRHLEEGSQKDNMSGAARRGRLKTKFSDEDILKAVGLVRSGKTTVEAAKELGMTQSFVSHLMRGHVRSHVTGIPKIGRKKRVVRS